ncbi:MAG: monooxygenase [Sphingomonadaceae bacterium]|nr:monooxygenase [Sphingomonadaceae bacterium]
MFRFTAILLAGLVSLGPAVSLLAKDRPAGSPVATIVTIKTPPGITRPMLEGGFKQAVPVYEKIPGLIRKYFIVNGDSFGGMYLWKDRASAEAWYSDAWKAKARATYGSEPQLTYFDAPVQIDRSAK